MQLVLPEVNGRKQTERFIDADRSNTASETGQIACNLIPQD